MIATPRPRSDDQPSHPTSPRKTPQAKEPQPKSPAQAQAQTEAATTPPAETTVLQQCQRLFQSGQTHEAIRLLDAALLKTDDTGAHHHLVTELAQELLNLVDHDRPDAEPRAELKKHLGTCKGIGCAILGLAKGGWWLPTEPFFVEPRLRGLFMQLSDRASVFELVDHQVNQQFQHAQGLVDADGFAQALDRLAQLHRLASDPVDVAWLARVLEQAQKLFPRLLDHTDEAFPPLRARCLGLIAACLTPDALRAKYGVQSRLELQAQVNADTGQWRWTKVAYPVEPRLTTKDSQREQRRFFADIDRLLQGSPPVPWDLAVKAVVTALKKHHWVPDYGVWLSWSLREARRNHMAPMLKELRKIEEELGLAEARKQLFLRLTEQIQSGMPWKEKTAIVDAVRGDAALGWALSANDEWALRELCAQRGDAEPLSELLEHQLPQGFVGSERLTALLALCEGDRLKPAARLGLIKAIGPHLGEEPELRKRFEDLRRNLRVRLSTRVAVPDAHTPPSADELVRRAREALSPWVVIDTSQPPLVRIRTSRAKAPATEEAREHFEATVSTWISVELLQESMSWQDLMGCVDEIEAVWQLTIDRNLLLDLCLQHVKRSETKNIKALQDHLPKLIEAHPGDGTLLELLKIVGNAEVSPHIRAVLLPRLMAWVLPRPNTALHTACVQAILSLPAGDIRAAAIERFVSAYGGDDAMSRLFGILGLLQEKPAPALQTLLRAVPPAPSHLGAWPGWRALCSTLWEGLATRLSAELALADTQDKTSTQLFNALSTLATPASDDMDQAIPQLFDLLGDLVQAVSRDQRAALLERLLALSLPWPGPPVPQMALRAMLQAALRGALQALLAREHRNPTAWRPSSHTNQFAIDEATVLFTHGFQYRLALRKGEDVPAQAHLRELRLRWDKTQVASHAPTMAALIARMFGLKPAPAPERPQ